MTVPRYDILAIDLDGTLLGADGQVSPGNRAAVERARRAGMLVLPCTGRGLVECQEVLAQFDHTGPVVVAGGAMICDGSTGQTLHRFGVNRHIVAASTAFIHDAGHAALVLKDRTETGHDYLVVTSESDHPVDPVSLWWFEEFNLTTRFVRSLEDDEHPDSTVRVGLVADSRDSVPLVDRMKAELGPEVLLHSFPALIADEHSKSGDREVHILEVFDKQAHKWGAIEWVAQRQALLGTRVAAIGDHVNDLTMLERSALGIAMGNAVPEAMEVSDVTTRRNIDDGVAHAIDQILDGVW